MSQVLDYSIINHRSKQKNYFELAMEQRALQLDSIKYKHLNDCSKDCRYIKVDDIHLQLRICGNCFANNKYKPYSTT